MPSLLLRYLSSCAIAAVLLASCWLHGYYQGKDVSKSDLVAYKAEIALANSKAQSRISSDFQTTLLERENSLQNLRNERDSLLVSLRNRTSRSKPPAISSTGSNAAETTGPTGCSPQQLYREDAEFLARFAADAETIRQELISTRRAYESIEKYFVQ